MLCNKNKHGKDETCCFYVFLYTKSWSCISVVLFGYIFSFSSVKCFKWSLVYVGVCCKFVWIVIKIHTIVSSLTCDGKPNYIDLTQLWLRYNSGSIAHFSLSELHNQLYQWKESTKYLRGFGYKFWSVSYIPYILYIDPIQTKNI